MSNIYANNINPRSGSTVTFPQNIKVLGTATYEDVANVDSVGIITAQTGIHVTSGNVGIGTDNPTGNLTISKAGGASVTLQRDDTTTSSNRTIGEIVFRGNDNSGSFEDCAKIRAISDKNHSDGDKPTSIEFFTTPDNTATPVERVRITSEGLLGVGTDNPTGNIEVTGNDGLNISNATRVGTLGAQWRFIPHNGAGSATNLRIYEGVGATEVLNITKTGDIGINNTSPTQRVHVGGNIEVTAYDSANGSGGYYYAKGLIVGNAYDANKTASDDRNGIIWQERGLDLDIATSDIIRQKITYEGTVCIGATMAPRTGFFNTNSIQPVFQVEQAGPSDNGRFLSIVSNAGASSGYCPTLLIGKSRGNTVGSAGLLADGDEIGAISFQGADGSHLVESARIVVTADGLTDADKMPGAISFQTTSDGASTPDEKLKILKDGVIWAKSSTSGAGNTDRGFYHGFSSPEGQSTGITMKSLGVGGGSGPFDTGVSVNTGNAGGVALVFASRNTSNGTATDGSVYLMQFYYDGNNTPLVVHLGGDNWVTWGQTAGNNLQASWSGVSNYSFGMIMLQ